MKEFLKGFTQYDDLLKLLVRRDVVLKYRRSFMGYLWSILNPLLVMLVMVAVFNTMFRFNVDNYPIYLLTGQMLFSLFSEATSQALNSITGSAVLMKKTNVPKYIFTISRVTSSLVTLLFSLGALIVVLLLTRTHVTWIALLFPLVILQEFVFCIGVGLFFAAASVYFRDMQHIWSVVLTAWMYLTPIFYPVDQIPQVLARWIWVLNPINSYIMQFRSLLLQGMVTDQATILIGIAHAVLALCLGVYTFSKGQNNFILYV